MAYLLTRLTALTRVTDPGKAGWQSESCSRNRASGTGPHPSGGGDRESPEGLPLARQTPP